jgi:arylsulfatase A-like enzyme
MCHYAVHTPLQAKKETVAKYESKEKTNQTNAAYGAMIESVDQAVGRIIATLEELNLIQRTMIIFTSDNGGLQDYATDNAPLRAGKGYPYEGGIRVPLIICWPQSVKANTVCNIPVTSVDFFPTLCDAVGLSLPDERIIDGESLFPLLKQSGTLERDAIFWHFPHYRGKIVPYSIIRKGAWKLIRRYEGKSFELFNLKEDLSEKQDLSDRMPEKVKELDSELSAWLKDTNAKIPKQNPDYAPDTEDVAKKQRH